LGLEVSLKADDAGDALAGPKVAAPLPEALGEGARRAAAQAWDLGGQELQLQAWGDSAGRLFSVGLDLAAIDPRVVVKLPATAQGMEAAAYLKDRSVRVTMTGARAAHRAPGLPGQRLRACSSRRLACVGHLVGS